MSKIGKEAYVEAIKKMGHLHGNMQVLSKLNAILKDTNANMAEAERLIESDGAIAATILSLSNSALYGFGEKTDSVRDALQKVGYDQALTLVGLALSKQVFMRDLDTYGISANDYWRYSYFSAVFMEQESGRVGLKEDDAYLFGLLHGIGKVVINELLVADEVEVLWDRFVVPEHWEVAMVGFPQEVAGSILLKSWDFDDAFCRLIRNQSNRAEVIRRPELSLLDFTRQVAIHLDDEEGLLKLLAPEGHLYLKRRAYREGEIEESIERAREKVVQVFNSLNIC